MKSADNRTVQSSGMDLTAQDKLLAMLRKELLYTMDTLKAAELAGREQILKAIAGLQTEIEELRREKTIELRELRKRTDRLERDVQGIKDTMRKKGCLAGGRPC